jgi:hypothetical protein
MELIGRFCRAPFQRQQLYVLRDKDQNYDKDLHTERILRVTQKYMDTVFSVFLVITLGF